MALLISVGCDADYGGAGWRQWRAGEGAATVAVKIDNFSFGPADADGAGGNDCDMDES